MGQLSLTCHAFPMDVDSSFGMMSFPLVYSVADVPGVLGGGSCCYKWRFRFLCVLLAWTSVTVSPRVLQHPPMSKADCSCPVKMAACHELESSGYYHAPPLSRLQP